MTGAEPRWLRRAARVGFAILALATVLLPWYRLDDYTPNGWDATWFARIALVAAAVGLVAGPSRVRVAAAAMAVLAVAYRLAVPPDFGFAFDGLEVPTERRIGVAVALAAALTALVAELLRAPRARPDPSPGSPRSGTAAEASASEPAGPAPA